MTAVGKEWYAEHMKQNT